MTAGRKSLPAVLHELHGNPSKTGQREEPEGVGDLWAPPSYMDEAQREQWNYAIAHSPPGLLTGTDREILASWVNACVEYVRAVVKVREMGQVVKTKDGNPIQNPFLGIMNRQAMLMSKFGSDLGFSPAARASLGSRAPDFSSANGQRVLTGSIAAYLEEKPDSLDA